MGLNFDVNLADARWIMDDLAGRDRPDQMRVFLLGPDGFEDCARVMALPDPQYEGQDHADVDSQIMADSPSDVDLVRDTVEVLARHSSTPDDLFFLMWDGYSWTPDLPTKIRLELAGVRKCALARGTREEWLAWSESDRDGGWPPAFMWPADRAWCVAYDVDAHFAGVGASAAAISDLQKLITHPVVRTSRDELPPTYF